MRNNEIFVRRLLAALGPGYYWTGQYSGFVILTGPDGAFGIWAGNPAHVHHARMGSKSPRCEFPNPAGGWLGMDIAATVAAIRKLFS